MAQVTASSVALKLQLQDGQIVEADLRDIGITGQRAMDRIRRSAPLANRELGRVAQTARTSRLATHELSNLSFQINDIATGLATGQSPFRVMAQQGGQVVQVMGQRGLGQIIPALGAGIASLISPTTLLLAGITAVGYGATRVFNSMRDDIEDTDEVIKRHDDLIRRIKDAYKEAEKGAISYGARSRSVLEADLRRNTEDLAAQLQRQSQDVLDFLARRDLQALGTATPLFRDVMAAVEAFRASVEDGEPEVEKFVNRIAEISETDDVTRSQRGFMNALRDTASAALETSEKLEEAREGIAGIGDDADDSAKAIERFNSAFERLEGGNRTITPRERALRDYEAAIEAATDIGEFARARDAYEARIQRIADLEAAANIQLPAARPRSIDHEKRRDPAGDAIRKQREQIDVLIREAAMIGETNAARARAVALLKAEHEIRRIGIDPQGRQADAYRDNASSIAALTDELDRHKQAWTEVQSAGTGAIDTIIEALDDGRLDDALDAVLKDLRRTLLQLAAINPIKNALFRTDLPTLSDAGGLGGVLGALTGRGFQRGASAAADRAVDFGGYLPPVTASAPVARPASAGPIPGGVAGQVWRFFAAKGLAPHQIAGIMGNVAQESAFNPQAIGDGGHAFGLFQHNDRRHRLFDFIGGRGNLGDVDAQLRFAWHELQTTESAAYRRLMASGNVRDATAAFGSFERPRGFSLENPEAMHGWTRRLEAAQDALARFSGQTGDVTQALTRMDGGLGDAVSALATGSNSLATTATSFTDQTGGLANSFARGLRNIIGALGGNSGGGGGGNVLATLFSVGAQVVPQAFGLYHGGGSPGGPSRRFDDPLRHGEMLAIAEAGERIFSRTDNFRLMEQIFDTSRVVKESQMMLARQALPATSVTIINNTPATISQSEQSDGRGGRRLELKIDEAVAKSMRPGAAGRRSVAEAFGLTEARIKR